MTKNVQIEPKQLSALQIFLTKVAAVTVASLVVVYVSLGMMSSYIEDAVGPLQGGRAFWGSVEAKLDALAKEPDMPPEKKKKIIGALRNLSKKYRPFIEALASDES